MPYAHIPLGNSNFKRPQEVLRYTFITIFVRINIDAFMNILFTINTYLGKFNFNKLRLCWNNEITPIVFENTYTIYMPMYNIEILVVTCEYSFSDFST